MTISNQGFKFKLYLEGILTPFIGATIAYNNFTPTAMIDMFPSSNFKSIKPGTLTHIFFKSLGTKDDYRLLFCGYVGGKSYQIRPDSRSYSLTAYGRLAMLHSITVGSVLDYTAAAANIRSLRYKKELSQTEQQSAMGTGLLKSHASIDTGITLDDAPPSYYLNMPQLAQQQSESGGADSQENMTQESTDKAFPAAKLSNALSITNPDMLKQAIINIISDACNSSHEYYAVAYYHRYFLESFISEMPATWANYIANWGGDNTSVRMQRFSQAVDNIISASLGGMSTLEALISQILQIFFAEMYEIPGLSTGGCVIMPRLLQSDIPTCNMILPSERIDIAISDGDGNRITRLITYSHPMTLPSDFTNNYGGNISLSGRTSSTNKNANFLAAAMYPDVFSIAKDEIENNGEIKTLKSYMLKNEEYIGSRIKTMAYPADYMHTHLDGQLHQDLTEQLFYEFKNAHMSVNINMPFAPNLIPGLQAVLFDKHAPVIFKIAALTHRIDNSGLAQTQVNGVNAEYFNAENLTLRHPHWYDQAYRPENIHEIYKSYFGCTSMSESFDTPGDLLGAYKAIYDKFESSETKSYMAEILTKRHLDSEADIFKQYAGSRVSQKFDKNNASDGEDVLIYKSDAFDNYAFDGYDYNMQSIKLINDRQTPVINYIKTIYGIIGDLYE